MRAIIHTSQADATEYELLLRDAHGIPRDGSGLPGVDIGGGIHAPPEQSRTVRYCEIVKHPTRNEWAVPIDAADESDLPTAQALARLVSSRMPRAAYDALVARLSTVVELGSEWTPGVGSGGGGP
jgi:hypothetical protein